MSQATVQLVQRFYDAFDKHDVSALLNVVHPEVEFKSLIVEVEGGFVGHDGVRLYLSDLFATFPDFRVEVDEVSPIGHGAWSRFGCGRVALRAVFRPTSRTGKP
jgi:ketosteroid isomerase-like protein